MRKWAKLLMSLPLVFALSAYVYSQTSSSSSSSGMGSSNQSASTASGSTQDTQNNQAATSETKSDHKGGKTLKGCVQQSEGAYLIQEDNGKTAMLTGQDLSGYVGQEVKVRGSFHKGGTAPATAGAGFGGATGSAGNSSSQGNNSANASAGTSDNEMATKPVAPPGQATSTSATDHPDENFVVSKVDKLSDQCKSAVGNPKSH
jgi:hypothetical protein